MIDFAMGSGQFMLSAGPGAAGVWLHANNNPSIVSNAPVGRGDTYAFASSGAFGTTALITPALLGGPYSSLIAGQAQYLGSNFANGDPLISFLDGAGLVQCQLQMNGLAQLVFTNRAGTQIGGTSGFALTPLTWAYIEAAVVFSVTGTGTCVVRVNGVAVLTVSGVTNATTVASAAAVSFQGGNAHGSGNTCYMRDFYVVDSLVSNVILGSIVSGVFTAGETLTQASSGATATLISSVPNKLLTGNVTGTPNATSNWTGGTSGAVFTTALIPQSANTSYLGDINVLEVYPNGPGVNSAWAANVGPFVVTAVSGSGTNWTFTGGWASGASNAYVGLNFNTTSCGTGNNQSGVECTASAAGSITLSFTGGSAQTGLTGSAAFQCLVQAGINKLGTRPNGDLTYIFDSTIGDISDFAHQTLAAALGHAFSGIILGVAHLSYMRKDDLGSRGVQQLLLSSGASAGGGIISLGNTYSYYMQIVESDPNTGTQFSQTGFNNTTLGAKVTS